ncbi:hypothetical protein [Halocynthiibacter namhaensis]|uniref:hypothetical protein n=1 Tax=Halocynthiibacter namhaensis TaxID=1290553 RepID=UPI00068F5C8F|nr:hypothetical protein [Halocynthiibacter namhaensis]
MSEDPRNTLPDDPLVSSPPSRLFLEWESYRRKRAMDAANLLPILGLLMFLVPILVSSGRDSISASGAMLYLFLAWCLLIVFSFWVSHLLRAREETLAQPTAQDETQTVSPNRASRSDARRNHGQL